MKKNNKLAIHIEEDPTSTISPNSTPGLTGGGHPRCPMRTMRGITMRYHIILPKL
jgi:hypothetical protein